MKSFSSFLEKFKKIKNPNEDKQQIASIITEILKRDINSEQISIVKNIISINTNNYLKTEIFMKKDQILSFLKDKGFIFEDIR